MKTIWKKLRFIRLDYVICVQVLNGVYDCFLQFHSILCINCIAITMEANNFSSRERKKPNWKENENKMSHDKRARDVI